MQIEAIIAVATVAAGALVQIASLKWKKQVTTALAVVLVVSVSLWINTSIRTASDQQPVTVTTPITVTTTIISPAPDTTQMIQSAQTTQLSGHIYKVYDIGMTWDDARQYCATRGGHLATITSPDEQEQVELLLSAQGMKSYWLGGRKIDGAWTWITGEPFEYSNWEEGQPDGVGDEAACYLQIFNTPDSNSVPVTWDDTYIAGDTGGGLKYQQIGTICETES